MSIYESGPLLAYCICAAALLGAVFGSFLNCTAWRVAHNQPWWTGRSRCPACGHTLEALDLIPVFSWLLLRGRCRHCGGKISPRYLAAEVCFAALTAACLLRFDLTALCLRNWVLLCCLFCLSLVDLEVFLIPDTTLVIPAAVWLLTLPWAGLDRWEILSHLASAVGFGGGILLLSLALDAILKKDSLGGGDIKLFALVGLYLGPVSTLFAVLLSALLGLVFLVLRRGRADEPIPFGPSIAAATAVMLLWGEGLSQWYLGLLGLA